MDKHFILTLLSTSGIGKKAVWQVIKHSQIKITSISELFDQLLETKHHYAKLKIPTMDELKFADELAYNIIELSSNNNIKIITPQDDFYPVNFKSINEPPVLLYYKGNPEILNHKFPVAIIGTREPTQYGLKVGKRISEFMTESGFVIVSGLAKGCDTAAHRGCLDSKGQTIAIFATGLDKVYPKENTELAEEIINNSGCILSEYPIGTQTRPNYFVERDRLQSGISKAVIVVETDIKGGTMHTVKYAKQQGRLIAAIYSHKETLRKNEKFQGNLEIVRLFGGKPISNEVDLNNLISELKGEIKNNNKVIFNESGQGEMF